MSLMKSLARVAAGVMLAKGIGSMMKNSQGGSSASAGTGAGSTTGSRPQSGSILGDLLGSNSGHPGTTKAGSGGLGDILGQVLSGRTGGAGGSRPYGGAHSPSGGGLGGILDQLTQGRTGSAGAGTSTSQAGSGGGLGSILAGGAAAGGLGGILGELLGGKQASAGTPSHSEGLAKKDSQPTNDSSFGDLFNDALANGGEPTTAPTPEQNALAGLMLKAMIQAAKSDGKVDEVEQARLMKEFGELDDEDRQFIREQMAAPVDAAALAREVPQGVGAQVYLMSVMAIDFDNRKEAEYLHSLATALGLDKATVNGIHEKIGATQLYA